MAYMYALPQHNSALSHAHKSLRHDSWARADVCWRAAAMEVQPIRANQPPLPCPGPCFGVFAPGAGGRFILVSHTVPSLKPPILAWRERDAPDIVRTPWPAGSHMQPPITAPRPVSALSSAASLPLSHRPEHYEEMLLLLA
ncbi:hypothetical protein EON62_06445, partial [archaeon]